MNKHLLAFIFIAPILFFGYINTGFSNKNNPPAQQTGAVGEPSCGFSNSTNSCHGTLSGATPVSDLLSLNTDVSLWVGVTEITSGFEYKPDSIYTLTFKIANPNTLNGFSLTAKNDQNLTSGTFSIPVGSNAKLSVSNSGYVNHDGNAGVSEWTFNWAAPAQDNGDVTFYATANRANNNNNWSGDEIIPFKVEIIEADDSTPNSITQIDITNQIIISNNPLINNELSLSLMVNEPKTYVFEIFDIQGRNISTHQETLHSGYKNIALPIASKGIFFIAIHTNKNEKALIKILNQ
jgi:hypothetical protein